MALSERLALIITANGSQAISEFNKTGVAAERSLGRAERGSARLGAQLTRAGAAMVAFGGVALFGLYKLAQASEEQTLAETRLQNTIQNMPELAGQSTSAFLDQASALQRVTVADDAAIVSAQAMLGTFHLTGQQVRELTPLVVDYSRKFGVDMVSAATQVGRAVSGSSAALQRNGIMLDQNVYATDRFGAVTTALRENVGGFAEQEGQTFNGQVEIMKNQLGELAEGVGVGVVGAFRQMIGAGQGVVDFFGSLSPGVQSTVGSLLTWGSAALVVSGGISTLAGAVMRMKGQIATGAAAIGKAVQALGGVGPAAGFALAGVAALGIAYLAFSDVQNDAAARADDYTRALEDQAAGTEDAVDAQIAQALASDDVIGRAAALGISAAEITSAVQDQGRAWADLKARRDEAIAAAAPGGADPVEDTAELLDLVDAIGTQRTAYLDAAAAGEQNASATAAVGATAAETEAAIDALSEALTDYFSQSFGVQGAQDDLLDQFDSLYESLLENGTAWSDNSAQARANRDELQGVVESTGAIVEAQSQAGEGGAAMNETIDETIARLQSARDRGLITSEAFTHYSDILNGMRPIVSTGFQTPGLPAADRLALAYDRHARSIPTRWNTIFNADISPAERRIQVLKEMIRQIAVNNILVQASIATAKIGGQASGTPSAPPGLSWVGEAGPELVRFRGGERVYNAADSAMMTGGGRSITIGQIVLPNVTDGDQLVAVLRRWSQVNGPLPVAVAA